MVATTAGWVKNFIKLEAAEFHSIKGTRSQDPGTRRNTKTSKGSFFAQKLSGLN